MYWREVLILLVLILWAISGASSCKTSKRIGLMLFCYGVNNEMNLNK